MKILILGGAGFLGTNLIHHYLDDPETVLTAADIAPFSELLASPRFPGKYDSVKLLHADICDSGRMFDLVQGHDVIFNCAAQSSHTLSLQNPLQDAAVNCTGTLNLLEAVRRGNPEAVVVYPSTTTAIGPLLEEVADESHQENPLEIYSANKGVAEKYYRIYHDVHGLRTVVLRFANVYGPFGKGEPYYGFINYFLRLAREDRELRIFGDGEQKRNVMYAGDAARAFALAAKTPELEGGLYHATSSFHLSVREIAETIVRIFGRGRVLHVPWPDDRRKIEVHSVAYSSEKLRAKTGWHAEINFETGLRLMAAALDISLAAALDRQS